MILALTSLLLVLMILAGTIKATKYYTLLYMVDYEKRIPFTIVGTIAVLVTMFIGFPNYGMNISLVLTVSVISIFYSVVKSVFIHGNTNSMGCVVAGVSQVCAIMSCLALYLSVFLLCVSFLTII